MKNYSLSSVFFVVSMLFTDLCYALNVTEEPYVKGSVLAQRYQQIIDHYHHFTL